MKNFNIKKHYFNILIIFSLIIHIAAVLVLIKLLKPQILISFEKQNTTVRFITNINRQRYTGRSGSNTLNTYSSDSISQINIEKTIISELTPPAQFSTTPSTQLSTRVQNMTENINQYNLNDVLSIDHILANELANINSCSATYSFSDNGNNRQLLSGSQDSFNDLTININHNCKLMLKVNNEGIITDIEIVESTGNLSLDNQIRIRVSEWIFSPSDTPLESIYFNIRLIKR